MKHALVHLSIGMMFLFMAWPRLASGADNLIYACVRKKDGSPRTISSSAITCGKDETLLTWNSGGSQGASALHIVDNTGKVIGPASQSAVVFLINGEAVGAQLDMNGFPGTRHFNFLYTSEDCSGTRYMADIDSALIRSGTNSGDRIFYATGPLQNMVFHSSEEFSPGVDVSLPGQCTTITSTGFLGLATSVNWKTDLGLTPPFHVE